MQLIYYDYTTWMQNRWIGLFPEIRHYKTFPALEEIQKATASVLWGSEKLARQVAMYLCHKYSGRKLREIGEQFEVGETAIAEARRLLSKRMARDEKLGEEVENVKVSLQI